MNTHASGSDASFLAKQRAYLVRLRAALRSLARTDEADEADVRSGSGDGAREYEDEAQKLMLLELDGNRVVRDLARLERVERALSKIKEGTYGVSDLSGKPIPRARLEAVPEAVCTLDEEAAHEGAMIGRPIT
jgi:DnaK suppressor protein